MTQETLLDAPLIHKFCSSLQAAEQEALREAADTGGIVLRIKSLRIEPNNLVVAGVIPKTALVFESSSVVQAHLQPRSMGTMRLTWNSLLHPGPDNAIGFLVLQTPVDAADQVSESEDGGNFWVALSIRRSLHTLEPGSIGAICCARCNRPIPQQRLLAVPNTRVCTNCQQKKEKK
ncbi:MAG: TraR/DksA C4-type zinc finger protein [Terracidiphilus sp.]